jgi:hypothetical protein
MPVERLVQVTGGLQVFRDERGVLVERVRMLLPDDVRQTPMQVRAF